MSKVVSLAAIRKIVDRRWDRVQVAEDLDEIDRALDDVYRAEAFYFNTVNVLKKQEKLCG